MEEALWVAHSLFQRGKASGSSANLSFRLGDKIYVTGSGTCFGRLQAYEFSVMSMAGEHLEGIRPSKEFPLHHKLYLKDSSVEAVIHTHSTYATLWSCLPHTDVTDCVPGHTPYLNMKVGTIGLVPYAQPGSEELFGLFEQALPLSDGFLLGRHGPVVAGKSMLEAFYGLEELEDSCRIAWELR